MSFAEKIKKLEEQMDTIRGEIEALQIEDGICRGMELTALKKLVSDDPVATKLVTDVVEKNLYAFGRASEDGSVSIYNVSNGICIPSPAGWREGVTSMCVAFSAAATAQQPAQLPTYQPSTIFRMKLVYDGGQPSQRMGLTLRGGAFLQVRPEKKMFASLVQWIEDMGTPRFGVAKLSLTDMRTRHEKLQDELNKMSTLSEKVQCIIETYKLRTHMYLESSPAKRYAYAVQGHENYLKDVKQSVANFTATTPNLTKVLACMARGMKKTQSRVEILERRANALSEEERNKEPLRMSWAGGKSWLYLKDGSVDCLMAMHQGKVYYKGSDMELHKQLTPTVVFLKWRGRDIPFKV